MTRRASASGRAKGKARSKAAPEQKEKLRLRKEKEKAKERERVDAERERARAKKEKERAQKLKEKEKEQERLKKEKELERAKKEKEKEQERLRKEKEKEKEQERLKKEKELERAKKEKEKEQREKQKEKERLEKEREREKQRKEKEKEQERLRKLKEREAEREAERKAREEERVRQKAEREAERERQRLEREAEREEARRQKEAERARKEAEREAYRKAKEAERERLRAEREAARRALEGKVARATKRGQRGDGLGRGTTTRVYRPDAIPDQSGTTRRLAEAASARLAATRPAAAVGSLAPSSAPIVETSDVAVVSTSTPSDGGVNPQPVVATSPPSTPQPVAEVSRGTPPPPALSVEERWARINERLEKTEAAFQREYRESFDMSWIYHDSALEGVVYTFQELKTATDPTVTVVADSSLQPVCEEIRRNRQTIELVRELAEKKRVPLNVDILKKLYVTLHPEEGDVKTVKYRKDIPQHRLYFHEYAAPDKIAYKVRQVIDWLNGPEPKKIKNALRVAARVHYDLLRVFPFQNDSGKVVRLLMNVILMRAGYPPAIIHSTERQKYYEALKGQLPIIIAMTNEAISNALLSIEKRLDEYEARGRS